MYQFSEQNHLVKGIDPVADAFEGTVYSDVVCLKNFSHLTAIIYKGVGTTGTSTITVQACDDATPSGTPTAIPFRYRAITSGDTPGALTAVANTGFTTTAGSSQLYVIEVDAEDLASADQAWVRIKCVQVADDPVLGGILLILSNPRFAAPFETAIA